MTSSLVLFYLLAGLSVLFSLLVVFQRNVVYSALFLAATLCVIAVLFVTLDAPMVGFLQILVYAGAIMILFLFVIMLLNPRALERRQLWWWGLGALGGLLLVLEVMALVSGFSRAGSPSQSLGKGFGSPEELAHSLFADFVLPFEVASVLLLVGLIGAVVLARRGE